MLSFLDFDLEITGQQCLEFMKMQQHLTHTEAIKLARSHEPAIAWPTIALALFVSLGFASVA